MNLQTIYNNGLIVWDSRQIRLRNQITEDIAERLENKLRDLNSAWRFYRIEAPTLIPQRNAIKHIKLLIGINGY
jgi:hydroxymethylpyrimidine pyrophosphatase-like HAD family hydrolase